MPGLLLAATNSEPQVLYNILAGPVLQGPAGPCCRLIIFDPIMEDIVLTEINI